jgi:hypothetical protein
MLRRSHYKARGRKVVDVENAIEQLSLLSAPETGFVDVPLGLYPYRGEAGVPSPSIKK